MNQENIVKIVLLLIVLINGLFLVRFLFDLKKNITFLKTEPGRPAIIGVWSYFVFFLSTFGISDFALSTIFYRKLKLIDDKKLPGTLNTQCVIPVAIMALAYISSIQVDITTLIVCIVAQVIGAYIGPKFVVKLKASTIRVIMGIGLLIASFFILAGIFNIMPQGGNLTGLSGAKLIIAAITLFIYGALNAAGIGSYAPTMATVYALGLSPAVAFPIMMGACTFSVPVGSMEFIKFGQYGRKITLGSITTGVLGVLTAVFLVKSFNSQQIKWVVVIVILYTAITMLIEEYKRRKSQV